MQKSSFRKGNRVEAVRRITEADFNGRRLHVHAQKGDHGEVLGSGPDEGWWNVAWKQSGTITVCHGDELRLVDGLRLVGDQ